MHREDFFFFDTSSICISTKSEIMAEVEDENGLLLWKQTIWLGHNLGHRPCIQCVVATCLVLRAACVCWSGKKRNEFPPFHRWRPLPPEVPGHRHPGPVLLLLRAAPGRVPLGGRRGPHPPFPVVVVGGGGGGVPGRRRLQAGVLLQPQHRARREDTGMQVRKVDKKKKRDKLTPSATSIQI